MSGPTGPGGYQGIQGPTGSAGPIGTTGMRGIQGPAGVTGPAGGVGIAGSTGIQLSNNGSLAQCASIRNTTIFSSLEDFTTPITFGVRNPGLTGSTSTSISGEYDLSGLNFYSTPLSFSNDNILIPGGGKYYISSVVETNRYFLPDDPAFTRISLDSFNGTTYSEIVPGTAARPGTPCYLYHYFTPSVDTRVAIRARIFDMSGGSEIEPPESLFTDVSTNFPNGILSIVKIW